MRGSRRLPAPPSACYAGSGSGDMPGDVAPPRRSGMTQDAGPPAPDHDPRMNVAEDVAGTPPPLPLTYERPQAGNDGPPHVPLGTFYRVNSSRASFGELRRDGGSPL